jgi:hypothetical protein
LNGAVVARTTVPSDPRLNPRLTHIARPVDGRYDAIVVQSVPAEAVEETRKLLTGSPVYTVYLSVGTRKDWILQYCVPRDRVATVSPSGFVLQINNPTPVTAPWPTFMLRGPVAVRSGQPYVVVHGFVTDSGKMERFNIVRPGSDDTNELLMTALAGWQFRPAMQDGRPITVEFLLAIPPDYL